MLWNVRLPLRQKVLLMTIFSLTVIVMIVSIIRVAIVGSSTRSSTQQPDISWVYFWSNIEMSTGKPLYFWKGSLNSAKVIFW